jgi:hypothetical protein
MPLRQATRLDLVVKSKTANSLGITIPPSLLLHTDEVAE